MPLTQPALWAQAQFGHANLNDPRRTRRLVSLATALAHQLGDCVSHLLLSPSEMEGAYRFICSNHVSAGFAVIAAHARDLATRLGNTMANVISVCDREADIYEYQYYKQKNIQRFVVRSMQRRRIDEHDNKRYDYARECQSAATRLVKIPQRGRRNARTALFDIKFARVTLKAPDNKASGPDIPLYYVGCIEQGEAADRLEWHLLTSEAIATQVSEIIGYYERCWLIENYHKLRKSAGTRVEALRMQSRDNLTRMCVILAFIAVRLLQLRFIKAQLSVKNWKLLWLKMEKKPLPGEAPDMVWAYKSQAILGGLVSVTDPPGRL